jgi:hypothetical protein
MITSLSRVTTLSNYLLLPCAIKHASFTYTKSNIECFALDFTTSPNIPQRITRTQVSDTYMLDVSPHSQLKTQNLISRSFRRKVSIYCITDLIPTLTSCESTPDPNLPTLTCELRRRQVNIGQTITRDDFLVKPMGTRVYIPTNCTIAYIITLLTPSSAVSNKMMGASTAEHSKLNINSDFT